MILSKKQYLAYRIARKFCSNGYASETIRAILQFMFIEIGINRMEASYSINNKASRRVIEQLGMQLEIGAKECYFCSRGYQDSNLFGV